MKKNDMIACGFGIAGAVFVCLPASPMGVCIGNACWVGANTAMIYKFVWAGEYSMIGLFGVYLAIAIIGVVCNLGGIL